MDKIFRKCDALIIISLILLSMLALAAAGKPPFNKGGDLYAVIYVNGKEIEAIPLSSAEIGYEINTDTSPSTVIRIEKNCACFLNAECRDKICVNTGNLTKSGDAAACLPAGVVIVLKSAGKSKVDIIAY
ncbi:MAG: NusG domain II-containing protein [Oscillospiraceae bacterium]|nr:NusG domain II-containing protein [Oscillospiraceae bacterium]